MWPPESAQQHRVLTSHGVPGAMQQLDVFGSQHSPAMHAPNPGTVAQERPHPPQLPASDMKLTQRPGAPAQKLGVPAGQAHAPLVQG
jgi:hypothetical protein